MKHHRYLCLEVLMQIENEYGLEIKNYGAPGHAYMTWAAKMAVEMGTGVPWIMCKEDDAPDPVVRFFSHYTRLAWVPLSSKLSAALNSFGSLFQLLVLIALIITRLENILIESKLYRKADFEYLGLPNVMLCLNLHLGDR